MHYSIIERRIDSLIRFFLCFLIFWLPYSPAVIEISVISGLLLWILKRSIMYYRGSGALAAFRLPLTPLNKPILVFGAVCVLASLGSPFWDQSLPNFLTKTLEWFIVYFLVIEGVTERKHIYLISGVFMVTLSATVLDSLIQYYVTYKDIFLGHTIEPGTRATAGFKTANGLGAYLTLAIPLILALICIREERLRYRLPMALISFLALWSLAVTFSHGAWVTTLCGITFFLSLFFFHQRRVELYFILGVLLILVTLWVYFGFVLTGGSDIAALRSNTASWRLNIWKDTIAMIKDSPLLGHGINTFMQLFEAYRTDVGNPTYAHNGYLQLTAETGLLGLAAFLWVIVALFRWVLTSMAAYGIEQDSIVLLTMGLGSGIFAFLIHGALDNNFYSLQLSVYLWFMIGLLVAMTREIQCLNPNER